MKGLWSAFVSLCGIVAGIFGHKDDKTAYDQGTQYGETKAASEQQAQTIKAVEDVKPLSDPIGRKPDRAAVDRVLGPYYR